MRIYTLVEVWRLFETDGNQINKTLHWIAVIIQKIVCAKSSGYEKSVSDNFFKRSICLNPRFSAPK